MKQVIRHLNNLNTAHKHVRKAQAIAVNPFEYVLDRILAGIIATVLPVPFVGELVIVFKKPILGMFLSLALTVIACIFMAITFLVSPAFLLTTLNASEVLPATEATSIDALKGYRESGFVNTDTPTKDPFGGNGTENSILTASFHDFRYYLTYHLVHEGMDIVPSQTYYSTNQAYLLTKQAIMFSTMSGTAHGYIDPYGALTVDITNTQGTLKTVYKHLKQIILPDGSVQSGEPVGIMGATGFAFGEHLHYEVRLNEGGTWVAVDPATYIN